MKQGSILKHYARTHLHYQHFSLQQCMRTPHSRRSITNQLYSLIPGTGRRTQSQLSRSPPVLHLGLDLGLKHLGLHNEYFVGLLSNLLPCKQESFTTHLGLHKWAHKSKYLKLLRVSPTPKLKTIGLTDSWACVQKGRALCRIMIALKKQQALVWPAVRLH